MMLQVGLRTDDSSLLARPFLVLLPGTNVPSQHSLSLPAPRVGCKTAPLSFRPQSSLWGTMHFSGFSSLPICEVTQSV